MRTSPAPATAHPRVPGPGDRALSSVLIATLAAELVVFSYCSASFNNEFNGGQWLFLGGIALMFIALPAFVLVSALFAFLLLRRGTYTRLATGSLVVAVVFGCPLPGFFLAKALSWPMAVLWHSWR